MRARFGGRRKVRRNGEKGKKRERRKKNERGGEGAGKE